MARRVLLGLAAPVLALAMALLITCLVLLAAGDSVSGFLSTIAEPPLARNVVNILNQTSVLYLAGLAAAIGFRMNLFNIGVEGQYRLAAFFAAVFAGQAWLPGMLNVAVAIVIAVAVGAAYAAIAGVLKVTRGVSEVISTIMLNFIAFSMIGYLMRQWGVVQGSALSTKPIPADSRVPGYSIIPGAPNYLFALSLLAVVAGVAYWVLLNKTRFGFELRATGASSTAAASTCGAWS